MVDKICVITGHFPPQHSAVGDYALRLSSILADGGAEVCVLTSSSTREIAATERIKVLAVTNGWGIKGVRQIIKILRQANPRIVSLQYTPQMYSRYGIALAVAMLPLAIRLILKLPVITTCHEFISPSPRTLRAALLQALYAAQTLLILIGSIRIIVPVERHIEILKRYYPPFARKARLIPVGSNIPVCTINNKIHVNNNALLQENWTIATLGTGHLWWNYEFALRVTSILLQKGYNIRLVCVGDIEKTNPSYFIRLRSLAERLDLNGRVTWTGYRAAKDVSFLLSAADIFLFTQITGPTMRSTALMAALSHGLPVVAIKGSDTDRYLIESDAIIFVSGNTTEQAVSKIDMLLSDNQLRFQWAEKAQELYKTRFSWDCIAKLHNEIFVDIAS